MSTRNFARGANMAYSRKYTRGKRGKANRLKRLAAYLKRYAATFAAVPDAVRVKAKSDRKLVRTKLRNMQTKPSTNPVLENLRSMRKDPHGHIGRQRRRYGDEGSGQH